jgi:hypothetical protein
MLKAILSMIPRGWVCDDRIFALGPDQSILYLVHSAQFIACHQFVFLERYDMLENAVPGPFLLNSPYGPQEVWDHLPQVQRQLIKRTCALRD